MKIHMWTGDLAPNFPRTVTLEIEILPRITSHKPGSNPEDYNALIENQRIEWE
jgi:hypothetical protein